MLAQLVSASDTQKHSKRILTSRILRQTGQIYSTIKCINRPTMSPLSPSETFEFPTYVPVPHLLKTASNSDNNTTRQNNKQMTLPQLSSVCLFKTVVFTYYHKSFLSKTISEQDKHSLHQAGKNVQNKICKLTLHSRQGNSSSHDMIWYTVHMYTFSERDSPNIKKSRLPSKQTCQHPMKI